MLKTAWNVLSLKWIPWPILLSLLIPASLFWAVSVWPEIEMMPWLAKAVFPSLLLISVVGFWPLLTYLVRKRLKGEIL